MSYPFASLNRAPAALGEPVAGVANSAYWAAPGKSSGEAPS
jgi:hypothetical protein